MSSAFTILGQKPLPCDKCTGECCTAIPLTPNQFKRICRALKAMPAEKFERLQKQRPAINQCMLLDHSNFQCSVYDARPGVCRVFGRHSRGIYTYAPERSQDLTDIEAAREMTDIVVENGRTVGITGLTTHDVIARIDSHVISWDEFKKGMEKL